MSRYEYAYVTLDGGLYMESSMFCLGAMFQRCIDELGMSGDQAAELFVGSGLAREFERQTPQYVAGMSGVEMVRLMLERKGVSKEVSDDFIIGNSIAFWTGEMIAYFQITTGCTYRRLFELCTYEQLSDLYYKYGECAASDVCEAIRKLVASAHADSALARLRKARGLNQAELAERTGVSLRSIQQYEQGVKDINHAAAVSVYKLSLVLGCAMEDLLDTACL